MRPVFIVFFCSVAFVLGANPSISESLSQANHLYQLGLEVPEVPKKEKYFNEALALYLKVEDQLPPRADAGLLNYNIGNTFTQLTEHPLAALYYYRALKTDPHNIRVHENLNYVKSKLNIDNQRYETVLFYPVTIMLFTAFSVIVVIFFSLYIWTRNSFWVSLSWLPIMLTFFLFVVGIYQSTFEPIDAVIIKSSLLFKNPNLNALYASEVPLAPGTKVHVLNSIDNGKWLKVIDDNGTVGFVNFELLRII